MTHQPGEHRPVLDAEVKAPEAGHVLVLVHSCAAGKGGGQIVSGEAAEDEVIPPAHQAAVGVLPGLALPEDDPVYGEAVGGQRLLHVAIFSILTKFSETSKKENALFRDTSHKCSVLLLHKI